MKRSGFTLIELAIALVIIGLLIGTVLKGRAMIEQAKVNRVASDVHGIVAAAYTFQNRYGYLPGDIPTSAKITINGVKGCTVKASTGYISSSQNQCAWKDLIAAGLVTGNLQAGTGPVSPFGSSYTFGYGAGRAGAASRASGTYIQLKNIPNTIAAELDRKYDDGHSYTGDVEDNNKYPSEGASIIGNTTMRWWAF